MSNAVEAADSRPSPADAKGGMPASEYVLSLERGLAVIKCFGEANPRQTLAEVARATGLSRAAARRFLLTLQALGYIESDGRYFSLRPQTLELGYAYLASLPWWRYAQRVADRVATELGQACAIGVLDGPAVVYVAYASAARFSVFNRSIGTRLPAYATAIGRVMLAALEPSAREAHIGTNLQKLTPFTVTDARTLQKLLDTVRKEGFALAKQELEIGLSSVGVPITDRGRHVVAGMSVSALVTDMTAKNLRTIVTTLKAASSEITDMLPT
jgi:IclR family pca regulon transcriptional regulator